MKGELVYFSQLCPGQIQRGERPYRVTLYKVQPKPGGRRFSEPQGQLEWSRPDEGRAVLVGVLAELYDRAEKLGEVV